MDSGKENTLGKCRYSGRTVNIDVLVMVVVVVELKIGDLAATIRFT